jgi:uncharacterized membrane protein (UPF0127 family)
MGRESLDEDSGMLFVFPADTQTGFWMEGTLVPLSIAFITSEGVVIDIQDMQPLDKTLHYPSGPYLYAIETNQGWYEDNGVEVGSEVELPEVKFEQS